MIAKQLVEQPVFEMANVYNKLVEALNEQSMIMPVVLLAKRYIERYYYKQDLNLQEVAQAVNVSPTYLSRLLKEELGASFIDYLTKVRIQYAIEFMGNPSYKIYEIADKVGYSTQHYFSTAFKKRWWVCLLPIMLRRGGSIVEMGFRIKKSYWILIFGYCDPWRMCL
ncbi:hypothetical protein GCM10020331_099180 [Ectobacillus funiculus]